MRNANNCQPCGANSTTWAPQTEIHLQGVDCAGNLADFVGKPGHITHTVPMPGAVQTVKLCNEEGLPISNGGCFQLAYYRVRRKIIFNQ